MGIERFMPMGFKVFLKSHPGLLNLIDRRIYRSQIPIFTDIQTQMGHHERRYLYGLARDVLPQTVIVEIGCLAGGSTYLLCQGARRSGSQVYSIDPFDLEPERQQAEGDGSEYLKTEKPSLQEVLRNITRYGLQEYATLIQGWSTQEAQTWNSTPIGLLWIDGNHRLTYQDFHAWKPHLADRAVCAFHDSNHPRYKRGRPDVSQSVERIIQEEGAEVIGRCQSITAITLPR